MRMPYKSHKIMTLANRKTSHSWNGYPARFIPPVAMSAGLQVIASDVGALADPIRFLPLAGCIAQRNDPQEILKEIKTLRDPGDGVSKLQALGLRQQQIPESAASEGGPSSDLHKKDFCAV